MAFDLLSFLLGKSTGSGGGGGSAALGPKKIRQNGVYRASSDNLDGYNTVTVEVPNTYAAADEGNVVSNGALVAQTSRTITENGTYDTTLNDEVVVNVPSSATTYGLLDYPVIITNGRTSGTISLKPILYNDSVEFAATAMNIAVGNSATVKNFMTDGVYIWFNINNVTHINYNEQSYTDFIKSDSNWKLKIPPGFNGTIPFIFTA